MKHVFSLAGLAVILGVLSGVWLCHMLNTYDLNPLVSNDGGVLYLPSGARDLMQLENLEPRDVVAFPFNLSGKARGQWFFEGDAPVELVNDKGLTIGRGFITAEGEWMTTRFVSFKGTVDRVGDAQLTENVFLILKRSNPSGLVENDASLELPLRLDY